MIQILIVEDDYRIADIHHSFLKKIDDVSIVGKALTGKEAIKLVSEYKVDLVLLDLYMPDMTGTKVIKALKKYKQDIDVIVISAAFEKEIVGEVIRDGIFDYIIKPIKKERLIETIFRYKKLRKELDYGEVIDQKFLDDYFGIQVDNSNASIQLTPKGIDPLTLEKVKEIMQRLKDGITAEEMGGRIGASRTTARRYLEYLISQNEISADLEYGAVGRPERKYYANHKTVS